jgi:DNA-binding beta-propeller fold protein YncE
LSWKEEKQMKQARKMSYRASAIVLGMGVLALLSGCKGFFTAITTNPNGGTSSFVYVTNVSSSGTGGTLTEYSLTTGVLAALSGSPITLPGTPTSIVVAPNNAFLFVGTNLGVFLYTINSDGTLTQGNSNTIVYQGPTTPVSMVVDSTSSWLIIANKNSTELDALPISATTGVPTTPTPESVSLSATTPLQLAIAPANNNIFVAMGVGGTDALSFTASSTSNPMGKPVTISLARSGSSSNAVAVDTTSAYLFVAESNTTSSLRLIAVSNLAKDVADYPVGNGPVSILADLSGSYVYVANTADATISGFSFSAGALTALANSPFVTERLPMALVEDSSKTYLIDAGFGANPNLWEYTFDTTAPGTLDVTTTTSTASTTPSLANALAVTH